VSKQMPRCFDGDPQGTNHQPGNGASTTRRSGTRESGSTHTARQRRIRPGHGAHLSDALAQASGTCLAVGWVLVEQRALLACWRPERSTVRRNSAAGDGSNSRRTPAPARCARGLRSPGAGPRARSRAPPESRRADRTRTRSVRPRRSRRGKQPVHQHAEHPLEGRAGARIRPAEASPAGVPRRDVAGSGVSSPQASRCANTPAAPKRSASSERPSLLSSPSVRNAEAPERLDQRFGLHAEAEQPQPAGRRASAGRPFHPARAAGASAPPGHPPARRSASAPPPRARDDQAHAGRRRSWRRPSRAARATPPASK